MGESHQSQIDASKSDSARRVFDEANRETKKAISEWLSLPLISIGPWFVGSFIVAIVMISATWLLAHFKSQGVEVLPDQHLNIVSAGYVHVVGRNLLVLALHAFICLAGFLSLYAVPSVGESQGPISRLLHMQVSKYAVWFIAGATAFSVTVQVMKLSDIAAEMSEFYAISVQSIMMSIIPHAVPELTAVFLPLSAFILLSRKDENRRLLAATLVSTCLALPILLVAALLEVSVWPHVFHYVT